MIRPENKTIFWLLVLICCTSALLFIEAVSVSILMLSVLSIVMMLDAYLTYKIPVPEVVRSHNETMPLGVKSKISLKFVNSSNKKTAFEVFDHFPAEHSMDGLSQKIELVKSQQAEMEYFITPRKRGEFQFGNVEIKIFSTFGFWCRYIKIGEESKIRVYPNYAEVIKFGLLAADQKVSQMGIHKRRQRGDGTNFEQLREYRRGDRLNRIDWRASSRMRKLISREYQIEKDQQVVLMLDCGRKMRSLDGEISHFDQSLNSMLLLSYVALRQGDSVGFVAFGGQERWIKPTKKTNAVNQILNKVYDLEVTKAPSDYLSAAEKVKTLIKKRALIIILTNVRNEDNAELKQAISLLSSQHLVLVVSLHEKCINETLDKKMTCFQDALDYSAVAEYRLSYKNVTKEIKNIRNSIFIDSEPEKLPSLLVNEYFSIKAKSLL